MEEVQLKIPDEILVKYKKNNISFSDEVKKLLVLDLFRREEISSGKAAEFLGISRRKFLEMLYKEGFSYFWGNIEDIKGEINIEI